MTLPPRTSPLEGKPLDEALRSVPSWQHEGKALRRTFTFSNFSVAIGFVNTVAIVAERADHHPDLLVHGWNKVDVILSTHSAGGVTENDIELARRIEQAIT